MSEENTNLINEYKDTIKKLYKQTSVLSVVAAGLFTASLFLALALLI